MDERVIWVSRESPVPPVPPVPPPKIINNLSVLTWNRWGECNERRPPFHRFHPLQTKCLLIKSIF